MLHACINTTQFQESTFEQTSGTLIQFVAKFVNLDSRKSTLCHGDAGSGVSGSGHSRDGGIR